MISSALCACLLAGAFCSQPHRLPIVIVSGPLSVQEESALKKTMQSGDAKECMAWAESRGWLTLVLKKGVCLVDPDFTELAESQAAALLLPMIGLGKRSATVSELGTAGRSFVNRSAWAFQGWQGEDVYKAVLGVGLVMELAISESGGPMQTVSIDLLEPCLDTQPLSLLQYRGDPNLLAGYVKGLSKTQPEPVVIVRSFNSSSELERSGLRTQAFGEINRLVSEREAQISSAFAAMKPKLPAALLDVQARLSNSGQIALSVLPERSKVALIERLKGGFKGDPQSVLIQGAAFALEVRGRLSVSSSETRDLVWKLPLPSPR